MINNFSNHCVIMHSKFDLDAHPSRISVEFCANDEWYEDEDWREEDGVWMDMEDILNEWYRHVYLNGRSDCVSPGQIEKVMEKRNVQPND